MGICSKSGCREEKRIKTMRKKYVLYILAIISVVAVSIGATWLVRRAGRAAAEGVASHWDARAAPTATPTAAPVDTQEPTKIISESSSEIPTVTAVPTAALEPETGSAGRRLPEKTGEFKAADVAKITTFWTDMDGREEEVLESLARDLPDFRPTSACRIEIRTDGENDYAIIRPNDEEEYFALIQMADTGVSLDLILLSEEKIKEIYTYGANISSLGDTERGNRK